MAGAVTALPALLPLYIPTQPAIALHAGSHASACASGCSRGKPAARRVAHRPSSPGVRLLEGGHLLLQHPQLPLQQHQLLLTFLERGCQAIALISSVSCERPRPRL